MTSTLLTTNFSFPLNFKKLLGKGGISIVITFNDMPNFNGAIVMHTLQTIKTPATLREIVMTIANKTDLPQDELIKPVKQTLDMGHRLGFLQKVNGRC